MISERVAWLLRSLTYIGGYWRAFTVGSPRWQFRSFPSNNIVPHMMLQTNHITATSHTFRHYELACGFEVNTGWWIGMWIWRKRNLGPELQCKEIQHSHTTEELWFWYVESYFFSTETKLKLSWNYGWPPEADFGSLNWVFICES